MDFIWSIFSSDFILDFGKEALHSEVIKYTIAFLIAARLHRRWVKEDMAKQFSLLRESIDHVADVMGKRIDDLDDRIDRIEQGKTKV